MSCLARGAKTLAAILLFALAQPAAAQTTYSWNFSGTGWNSASSWSPGGGPPTAADTAVIGVFDGPTLNMPNFSGNAAVGQLRILGPRSLSTSTITGNGNTFTLGTGGAMTDPAFAFRGTFGTTVNLNNLTVNVATGTSFATGSYASFVGAMEFPGSIGSRVILQNGAQLRLVDAAGTTNYNLTISGSQLVLTSGTTVTNGRGVNTAPQGAIRFEGGGILNVNGANGAATTFNLNQLAAASGHASIGVFAGSTTGSTIQLNLGNGTLQAGIDRFARDSSGTAIGGGIGTLEFAFNGSGTNQIPGFTGSVGSVVLAPGATGIPTLNGVITDSSGSPYVILTGQLSGVSFAGRFATINSATGVVTAQTGTTRNETNLSSVAANENVVYKPALGGNPTLANNISPMTLVLEPPGTGQSIDLNGHTLTTNGLMLDQTAAGMNGSDFAINNGTIAGNGSAVRNIFVLGPTSTTSLSIGASFGAGGPVVKSGSGMLRLTGTTDQMNIGQNMAINQGFIRAQIDGPTANFGTNNTLLFRGGTLEVDAGGGTSTFSRSLGTGLGQVNWTAGTDFASRGSGGFSVVNGNLTVNIGGDGHQLLWHGFTGDSQFFLRSGSALRFGSSQTNGVITFANDLALDDGSASNPFETRQILVDIATAQSSNTAIRTRLTGVISGGPNSMLSKYGVGTLELPEANTYQGGTVVDQGTVLLTNTSGSATGTGRVVVNGNLRGNGIIAPSAGNGLTALSGSFVFLDRGDLQNPGHLQIGTAGVNNPVTLRTGSNLIAILNSANFDPAGGPTSYSRLTVRGTGTTTITGAALTVGLPNGFTPSASDVFGILDNQTGNAITGTFNGIADQQRVNAVLLDNTLIGSFQVTYFGDISGSGISTSGGNDIVLFNFQPVPEPASILAICSGGFAALGLIRRVRRRPAKTL